jgi:hypothetical protein
MGATMPELISWAVAAILGFSTFLIVLSNI